jgi:spore germination cell wall hydrolase CwlJ-like protein
MPSMIKRAILIGVAVLTTAIVIELTQAAGASNAYYKLGEPEVVVVPTVSKEYEKDSVQNLNRQIDEQIVCLARNIYWEARNQSKLGMIAVGRVVLNRVNSERYPSTICEVVHEGPTRESWKTKKDETLADKDREFQPVKNRCQFSWYCDGTKDEVQPGEESIYELAYSIARNIVLHNKWAGIVEGATHYHATYVSPNWADKNKLTVRIDDHLFYKL